MLNAGVLPQHFITHSKIKGPVGFLWERLVREHSNLTKFIHDPNYYYLNRDFKFFRHGNYMVVAPRPRSLYHHRRRVLLYFILPRHRPLLNIQGETMSET